MKDGVPKGTGNSRFLKSAISTATTWEQFRTMLVNGTLPIDLGGVNAAGWQVLGDALNKANLLPDSVATALGLSGNPQVKDALNLIGSRAKIQTLTYVGTGTCGSASPNSLTFTFAPQIVILASKKDGGLGDPVVMLRGATEVPYWTASSSVDTGAFWNVTWNNRTVSWYAAREIRTGAVVTWPPVQKNTQGETFLCVALG